MNAIGGLRLSDSAGPSNAGRGYYSTLKITFEASDREVSKAFHARALETHPDKTGSKDQTLLDEFQACTTAYSVLHNATAKHAYLTMYRIRCHLHQQAHKAGQTLAPFYVFHVKKKDATGLETPQRMLTLDLLAGTMQNWKKSEAHRLTPLSHVKEVTRTSDTSFTISFHAAADAEQRQRLARRASGQTGESGSAATEPPAAGAGAGVFGRRGSATAAQRDYKLSVESPAQCELYVSILHAVAQRHMPPDDDSYFPPPSLRKGFVEKQGRSGEWFRRWIILGTSNLLIFRDSSCAQMVNAIPIDAAVSSGKRERRQRQGAVTSAAAPATSAARQQHPAPQHVKATHQ